MEATRKVFFKFFKEVIGFKDDEIICIDRKEFTVKIINGVLVYETKFSDSTKEQITNLGLPIFTDT